MGQWSGHHGWTFGGLRTCLRGSFEGFLKGTLLFHENMRISLIRGVRVVAKPSSSRVSRDEEKRGRGMSFVFLLNDDDDDFPIRQLLANHKPPISFSSTVEKKHSLAYRHITTAVLQETDKAFLICRTATNKAMNKRT